MVIVWGVLMFAAIGACTASLLALRAIDWAMTRFRMRSEKRQLELRIPRARARRAG